MSPDPTTPAPAHGGAPGRAAAPEPTAAELAQEADLASRIVRAQAEAVAGLGARLGPPFHQAVGIVARCSQAGGTILVSGLGKSGLIGAKVSATLASLGLASHFVHPTEAAHGDLGNFRPRDACVALSYSGQTDELIALTGVLRQDGIAVIGITGGGAGCALARGCDVTLDTGPVEESAGLSPAPTVSTTAALVIGDALALCAARRLGLGEEAFARRHPGGSLGGMMRPVTEALRFVVGRNLTPVPMGLSVGEALSASETGRRPGAMLVIDPGTGALAGIFTDGDLRRLVLRDPGALRDPVEAHMTRSPGTLRHDQRVREAVQMIQQHRRDEIPVVDDRGRPVGLLDVQDLIALRLVKEG